MSRTARLPASVGWLLATWRGPAVCNPQFMVEATRRSSIPLCALLLAGCLAAPPDPNEGEGEGGIPRPVSVCSGDPGPPLESGERWSIGSLPGWTQQDAVAGDLEDWFLALGIFNHVLHGSIATDAEGTVSYQSADLSGSAQSCAGVVAAHRLGYPIRIALGGDLDGPAIRAAASGTSRAVLVDNLIAFIDEYGYDGVSIAWFEQVEPADLAALAAELHEAFAQRTPRPLLTIDVASDALDPFLIAALSESVDAVNVMSYQADWQEELGRYLDAGVPAGLINLGIGLSFDDITPAMVAEKIELARTAGLKGVESWEVGALGEQGDARLGAYAALFE